MFPDSNELYIDLLATGWTEKTLYPPYPIIKLGIVRTTHHLNSVSDEIILHGIICFLPISVKPPIRSNLSFLCLRLFLTTYLQVSSLNELIKEELQSTAIFGFVPSFHGGHLSTTNFSSLDPLLLGSVSCNKAYLGFRLGVCRSVLWNHTNFLPYPSFVLLRALFMMPGWALPTRCHRSLVFR